MGHKLLSDSQPSLLVEYSRIIANQLVEKQLIW